MSAFKPAVGPSVVSEAGEPASPKAAEAHNKIIIDGVEKPNFIHNGTNNTARIGIVPNDVPMPIVIKSPIIRIADVARNFEFSINGSIESTSVSIPPVSLRTRAYPAQTSITNAIYPIKPTPSFIRKSICLCDTALKPNITHKPINAPRGNEPLINWIIRVIIAPNNVI